MNKLISIIIPVKNGEKYIAETLDGIKKQDLNTEIIVFDDGSTDNTAEIAKKYDCKVITHKTSKGPVVAKNSALKIAQGEYIMFHDADDVMNENLDNSGDISAVMAKVRDFYSPDLSEEEKTRTLIKKEPYYGLFTGAVLIRKSVFEKIGLFNESVTAGEIIDWQSKMCANHLKIKKLDFVATNRRIHSSNFGKTQQKTEYKDYARALRERLKLRN